MKNIAVLAGGYTSVSSAFSTERNTALTSISLPLKSKANRQNSTMPTLLSTVLQAKTVKSRLGSICLVSPTPPAMFSRR